MVVDVVDRAGLAMTSGSGNQPKLRKGIFGLLWVRTRKQSRTELHETHPASFDPFEPECLSIRIVIARSGPIADFDACASEKGVGPDPTRREGG